MIDQETIKNLAMLSRLQFSEEELKTYTSDISDIFNYATILQKINTSEITPSAHAIPLENVYVKDQEKSHENTDELLENAPEQEDHAFKVPRILVD